MAASGEDLKPLGPFPKGMDNRHLSIELPDDTLRDAENVDITDTGITLSRKGATQVYSGDVRSVFAAHKRLYWAQGNELRADHLSPVVVVTPISPVPISYVEINNELYWSNGAESGRILAGPPPLNFPWTTPIPSAPALAPSAVGGMYEGRYQVTQTFVGSDGREGGASGASFVDVPPAGGITATLPQPAPSDTYTASIRLYVSGPNGKELFHFETVPVGTLIVLITSGRRGRQLESYLADQLPPGQILAHLDGRLYSAQDETVRYSFPFNFGLMDLAADYWMFPKRPSVMLSCVDGLYVVADGVYWLNSANPKEAKAIRLSADEAVPGTGVYIPNSKQVAWFGQHGWVVGSPGGKIETPMDDRIAVNTYQRGAGFFREQRGIRQVVSSLHQEGLRSKFVASDYMDAEVVKGKR